jgi:hypothetical protein
VRRPGGAEIIAIRRDFKAACDHTVRVEGMRAVVSTRVELNKHQLWSPTSFAKHISAYIQRATVTSTKTGCCREDATHAN